MYRYGDRRQRMFFPECIDDYVSADAPVRAYDTIIEAMDLNQMGQRLNRHGADEKKRQINYCAGVVCRSCIYFGQCTPNRRHGRKVTRLFNEAVREKLETLYEQPSSRAIFKRRKERAEHPLTPVQTRQSPRNIIRERQKNAIQKERLPPNRLRHSLFA